MHRGGKSMFNYQDYCASADYIRARLGDFKPEVLIILGSGLGGLADEVNSPTYIPYGEIPHFAQSTAIGHAGRFVAGNIGQRRVLMMQGRFHIYEGYDAQQVAYPVRVAKLLGINSMIITNAAGGVNFAFKPGNLMLITDFIKFNIPNPLIGPNMDEFGPRFPDMTHTFDNEYIELFSTIAQEKGETLQRGNYFYMSGPQFETPAEIRAIRMLGGDAVGMSTVPECISASHAQLRVLGVSLITNCAAGILDQPISGEEVVVEADKASARFKGYIAEFLQRMPL